ncbi:hypothetical protein [Demequina gelatinilytica]|uniref:hypothetical protein n=1 Tax=Demequina gelatinilytica TaxID=1638980 RepID=UPI000A57A5B2|nr:hypothetical protein [Demequina gelatinilytica]
MAFDAPNARQRANQNIQIVYAMRPPFVKRAIVSLIFGILAAVTCMTVVLGIAFGATAILTGVSALRVISQSWEPRSGKVQAIAGISFGSIGVLGALMFVLAIQGLSAAIGAQ